MRENLIDDKVSALIENSRALENLENEIHMSYVLQQEMRNAQLNQGSDLDNGTLALHPLISICAQSVIQIF